MQIHLQNNKKQQKQEKKAKLVGYSLNLLQKYAWRSTLWNEKDSSSQYYKIINRKYKQRFWLVCVSEPQEVTRLVSRVDKYHLSIDAIHIFDIPSCILTWRIKNRRFNYRINSRYNFI